MKRFLAIVLTCLILLSFAACGGNKDGVKYGSFELGGIDGMHEHDNKDHPAQFDEGETVNYNNLSAALLDLETGKIDLFVTEKSTADYIIARNDKFTVDITGRMTNFSMMTNDTNAEVYNIINNAIKAMKKDGTLDTLIENELKAYIESDPAAKDLPKFYGAETIKVGVTGDLPPMDFVASNGNAAGFNIALLTEIANRTQVNIELVQIETGARPMALSSGKVDAVFWTKSVTCVEHNETWEETVANTLVTESYFSDCAAVITLKSDK